MSNEQSFSQDNIVDLIRSIAFQLERIGDLIESIVSSGDKNSVPIIENDSIGTCPSCHSSKVLVEGNYPKVVYKCTDCNQIWVNNGEFFDS